MAEFELTGRPLVELPADAKVRCGLEAIIESLQDLIYVDSREHLLYTQSANKS